MKIVRVRKPQTPPPFGDNGQYSGKRLFIIIIYLKCRQQASYSLGQSGPSILHGFISSQDCLWFGLVGFSCFMLKYIAKLLFFFFAFSLLYISMYINDFFFLYIYIIVVDVVLAAASHSSSPRLAAVIHSPVGRGPFQNLCKFKDANLKINVLKFIEAVALFLPNHIRVALLFFL